MELVDPPKPAPFAPEVLSVEQARQLLAAVVEHRHGSLWAFLLDSGCRFGEAAGLQWPDVDLEAATVTIRQQIVRRKNDDGTYALVLDDPKSDAGVRSIPLTRWGLAALRRQRILVGEPRLKAGAQWLANDLVFPGRHGQPLRETHVNDQWHRLLEQTGLPERLRMHDLRPTKGARLADSGVSTLAIQRTVGHSAIAITADRYISRLDAELRRATDRWSELLEPAAPEADGQAGS
ncbi:MAG: site-specific integrase [Chloroflexi bacterium]|nr:site-specific integrase [Chloroflexota bacterium]